MRGKPSTRGLQGTRRRIIPAHAGQTTSGLPGSVTSSDHPRACGANVEMHASLGSHVGSSPRMRGKLRQQLHVPELFRIIPAHAGQTVSIVPRSFASRFAGSSPRMRGKLICRFCRRCRMRIIPAHAGQTTRTTSCPARYPDHPRACGANLGKIGSLFGSFGSSPRMRGKRRPRPCPRTPVRIIPAHAGQTVRFYAKTLERWTLNNWIRTVAPIFVLLFLPPVIGQNAYIERHYSNQSFSWFSKLHYASAFDLSLVA